MIPLVLNHSPIKLVNIAITKDNIQENKPIPLLKLAPLLRSSEINASSNIDILRWMHDENKYLVWQQQI